MKYHRLNIGLTQQELASLVQLHADTIYLLENNKARVHVTYILAIEKSLGCRLTNFDEYYDFARDRGQYDATAL